MSEATKDFRAACRAHSDAALQVLIGLMKSPKAPASVRLNAATYLLDQGHGRALQSTADVTVTRPTEEMSDDELIAIVREAYPNDPIYGKGAAVTTNTKEMSP